jgi:hypothetical protein
METAFLLLFGLSGGTRHYPLWTVDEFVGAFGVQEGFVVVVAATR